MRKLAIRSAVGTGLVAVMLGVGVAAEPPLVLPPPKPLDEPRKLRTELEALAAEREAAAKELVEQPGPAAERAKLRAQLLDLVKRVGEKKMAPATPPMPPPRSLKDLPSVPPAVPRVAAEEIFKPGDSLRAAQNYFRVGEVDTAHRIFKQIDPNALSKEDRAFVQYMTACCLRKMNRLSEAEALYREVTVNNDDPFYVENAVWQLGTMKAIQELEANLEQLRSRRKSK